MTEVERSFYDDIREKKSIKNSASKTNRTGKGPVRFPSDYLSRKEKQAMNGECKSWKFSEFPDRKEFDKMPDDIKIQYLNWILNVYNVGLATISKTVFGQSASNLGLMLKRCPEISKYINTPPKGFRVSYTDVKRLENDIKKAREPKSVVEAEPDKVNDTDFTPAEKEFISTFLAPISEKTDLPAEESTDISDNAVTIPMQSMEFSMNGFDMDFIDMIRQRFGDQKICVRISVFVEKEY